MPLTRRRQLGSSLSAPATPTGSGPTVPRAPLPDWWWRQSLRTRRIIAGGIVAALVVGIWALVVGGGDTQPSARTRAELFVERLPRQRVATWDRVAECESAGDWAAATGNGYYGGLQISQATWLEFGGTGSPDEASREEQIMIAESIQADEGWGAWPACAAQLDLG